MKYVLLLDCCGLNGPFHMLAGDINIIIIMGSPNLYIFVGGNKGNKQYFGDGFFQSKL